MEANNLQQHQRLHSNNTSGLQLSYSPSGFCTAGGMSASELGGEIADSVLNSKNLNMTAEDLAVPSLLHQD